MAINSTSSRIGTPYNLPPGGSHDLLLINYRDGFPEGRLAFAVNLTPMKVTGIQKVAQLFIKTLMTSTGSDPFYPNKGTFFATIVRGSNITSDNAALMSDIGDAVNQAATQTSASTRAFSKDPSSQLQSIEILGLDASNDSAVLYLKMRTVAGEDAAITLPFPTFGVL